MKITNSLQGEGWKIIKSEKDMIFAERKSTKKLALFIDQSKDFNEVEILRVWTKKGFHPFTYKETNKGVVYYDLLFDEPVKIP